MTVIRFEKPANIWSTNQDRNLHWAKRRELIQIWKHTAFIYARKAKVKPQPPSYVDIQIPVHNNIRRDPHNYVGTICKAVVDGLVRAGCWPDDNGDWVTVREPTLVVGTEVVVAISPRRVTVM